jgi:hypothetical protein
MRKSYATISDNNIVHNPNIHLNNIGVCGYACILSWKGKKMYDFQFSHTLNLNNFLFVDARDMNRPEYKRTFELNSGSENIMHNRYVVEEIGAVEYG